MIETSVPGSKSITNRALVLAGLASGKSVLHGALDSDDTRHMQNALKSLGIKVRKRKRDLLVYGGKFNKSSSPIYCGNAGTAMRFLTAILATQEFESTLTGDSRMCERPIKDLAFALKSLGAKVSFLKREGFPPIRVQGPLVGGKCAVSGKISSQFLSGLLLAAFFARGKVEISVKRTLVSAPYVDMTIDLMRSFGVQITRDGYRKFIINPGRYKARNFEIEGDASSASYFYGLGALTGEKIVVKNLPRNSIRADIKFLDALKLLQTKNYKSLTINCRDFPDSAMTLTVICAFTEGKFTLTGLSNLRAKECDRLHALKTELRKIGCRVRELKDGLQIHGDPAKLHGARIETYNDHRMAMCFGMAGFVLPGIKIINPQCVTKTYPNFWKDLAKLKKEFRAKNIILTGMRGSGKSKLGKALAIKLHRQFVDIDEVVEKMAGTTIVNIVESKGWKAFRDLEKRATAKVAKLKSAVIATGGGTLMYPSNARALKKNGKVIFLDSNIVTLQKRLLRKKDRPSLAGKKNYLEELAGIYRKRKPLYIKVSDAILDVSQNSSDKDGDVARNTKKILKIVSRQGLT